MTLPRRSAADFMPWTRSGVADRLLDGHRRVQRGVGVLEHHLDVAPDARAAGGGSARRCPVPLEDGSSPSVAGTRPSSARPSVDLPLPLSPTRPTTSPRPQRQVDAVDRLDGAGVAARTGARTRCRAGSKCTDRSRMSTTVSVRWRRRSQASSATAELLLLRVARSRRAGSASSGPASQHSTRPPPVRSMSTGFVVGADVHRVRAPRVEAAARRRVDQVRRRAGDEVEARRAQRDRRAQQLAGVGVLRVAEDVATVALLDDPAGVHHRDPVARLGDDAEVVGDQQQRRCRSCGAGR